MDAKRYRGDMQDHPAEKYNAVDRVPCEMSNVILHLLPGR